MGTLYTLQSRLPVELRLNGLSSITEANKFLNAYIKKFNKRFALPVDNIKSVFETQPNTETINLTLAVLSSRKIDNGSCIKYHKHYYLPVSKAFDLAELPKLQRKNIYRQCPTLGNSHHLTNI